MYSAAPRCSDAWSPRSVPDCCRLPPSEARAETEISRPAAKEANWPANLRIWRGMGVVLVMHRHPFRHRLGLVELGPQRHRDEEREVEEGEEAADDGFDRVGTRDGAAVDEPH